MSLPTGTALVAALAIAGLVGSPAVAAETRDPVTPETSGISGTSEPAQDAGLVGDAYAAPGDNACSWRIGTDAVEKQLTFDPSAGTFTLTSFKNKLTGAEYIDATASSEFRTRWDGETVTGSSPGWSCVEGTQSQVDVGGEPAIRVDVSVGRADLRVSRHYVIYPGESLIREWTDYRNTGDGPHRLGDPSFLEQNLMGDEIRAGNVALNHMTGAKSVAGSWNLQTTSLTDYSRVFDSYDAFGCTATVQGWQDFTMYTESGYLGMRQWADDAGTSTGAVWPDAMHPGPGNDVARTWTATADGTISIDSNPKKIRPGGNGVVVKITKNSQTIWGPETLPGYSATGIEADVADVPVVKGDEIRFELNNNGEWSYDIMDWDPAVSYVDGPTFQASEGFSNTQGKNGWRFQHYKSGGCNKSWKETSSSYMPWFAMWNEDRKDGVYVGFDYQGRWAAPVGNQNGGQGALSLMIPDYDKVLAAGETVRSPKAFVGVYQTDLDDMTNRMLDWQYRYMWDYTRDEWFPGVRVAGDWNSGSHWGGNWDQAGLLQGVFALSERLGSMGADIYHRDNGWWNTPGDWEGPNFKLSNDYLAKSGMKQLIYMMAYSANTDSKVYKDNPEWFQTPSPCGYADRLIDLTNPEAERWMGDMLIGKAQDWGDFEWRNDACSNGPWDGARQLAQYQAYHRVQQRFLEALPGSAIQGVNSGGHEIGFEYMRMASDISITDRSGAEEMYDASRLFPVDKMSGIGDLWQLPGCDVSFNVLLQSNLPEFTRRSDAAPRMECMRELIETYHYLNAQGVVGRWVWQYHPQGTDGDRNWLERLSRDKSRGLVTYSGAGSTSKATMYPKGLNPSATYDVRYELRSGSELRAGADLMENGVTFPQGVERGELVYLNLPDHPGSGTDKTPPAAPDSVTAELGTNMGSRGVEVNWAPASDDNWVSRYEVLRNGEVIATVAKGTFYFDHTPAATPSATYAVRTVDGDDNRSPANRAGGSDTVPTRVIDDEPAGGISYSGAWQHDTKLPSAFNGTLSTSSVVDACRTACQGFSDVQGANNWRYQQQVPDGTWVDYGLYSESGYQGMRQWSDDAGTSTGAVWPSGMHPGPDRDAARTWVAPKDGLVYINSNPRKLAGGGDGVVVKITKNGETIWGPKTVDASDITTGVQANVDGVPVVTGDKVRFVVNRNGAWFSDATSWDPDIAYEPIAPPSKAAADYTFTGSQVTWYAKLGPDYGKAQVSIDGQPDAVIDLYAPGNDNWSVPIYTKTFTRPGRHTITISETGERHALSRGTGLSIDGFQVVVAGAEVTEDGASTVSYEGSGWNRGSQARASGGQLTATSQAGDRASFAFEGQRIEWVGRICPACGEADVYIDGKFATRVDTYGYRGPNVWQTPLFVKSWPKAGRHSIEIRAVGTKNFDSTGTAVNLDSFQVRGGDDR